MNVDDDLLICEEVKKSVKTWSTKTKKEEIESTFTDYKKFILRKWIFMAVCVVIMIFVAGTAITIGNFSIGILESYEVIWNHITGNIIDEQLDFIVIDLRLPRIVTGIVAGAGLAVAGVAMQSILKNPLADPYTTGVSSGAGFGATLAITLGVSFSTGQYAIVINAFLFALVPAFVIMSVAKMKNASPTVMIMAGVAIMYIFNAMTTVLKLWAKPDDLAGVDKWQVGTLASTSWSDIALIAVVVIIGIIAIQYLSRKLNVLATGDENAKALGINVDNLRIICMLLVACVSATVVSFTGLIGFVGLVAPHVVRLFIGADNRYLVPASCLFGAALMISADLIGRTILAPTVLQVGVITSFLGGPLFLWLIIRRKEDIWG